MKPQILITALVLDSSPFVAESVVASLQSRGYQATWATSRAEAERVLFSGPATDVLIVHGHLSGDDSPGQFAAEAALAFPNLAVVLTSSDPEADRSYLPTHAVVLGKPFGLDSLLTAVTEVLALRAIRSPSAPS
jgi:CheY-like chemotaxis protein